MPHFMIDYSKNLEARVNIQALCDKIRQIAGDLDCFPMAGVRVRATAVDFYSIADGNPDHAYIDISVRLRAGRPDAVKQHAVETLFNDVHEFLKPAMQTSSIALSMEMRDIDPNLSPKAGSTRNFIQGAE